MPDVNQDQPEGGKGGRPRDGEDQRLVPANEVSEIVSRRVNEVRAEADRKNAELQRQLDELKQQKAAPPPKVYTREQLAEAVEKGSLTQTQANAVWDRQQQESTRRAATEAAAAVVQEADRTKTLNERIAKYTDHDPDLLTEGSDARNRISAEVKRQQTEFGLTGLAAEYAALRVVYGDHDKLRGSKERSRSSHQESMGGGGFDGERAEPGEIKLASDGSLRGLSAAERAHYQKLIDRGMYADWKAVADEMKYANPGLRQRVAARR